MDYDYARNGEGGGPDIAFVSQHALTAAQVATLDAAFPTQGYVAYPRVEVTYRPNHVADDVWGAIEALGYTEDGVWPSRYRTGVVAGVFPTWAALELLRAGSTVVEFLNHPPARAKGVFVCKGAYVHTLLESRFVPCPVPPEEQEEASLAPGQAR